MLGEPATFYFFYAHTSKTTRMADELMLKRAYQGSDGAMLTALNAGYNAFVADLEAFTAFDASFSPEWAAGWLAEIEAAVSILDDHAQMYAMAGETEQVLDLMKQARNKWGELKFFIKKAFPDDGPMLHLFGASAFKAARMNQPKMIEFLLGLHSAATEYAAALLTAGCTQERIDEIQSICDALIQKNDVQNRTRRGRPRLTAQRIAALNAPYRKLMLVNEAAQIVFMSSAAKRKQYVFLPGRRRKKKEEVDEG
jgi:tryptophan 2,3-dioxygenase